MAGVVAQRILENGVARAEPTLAEFRDRFEPGHFFVELQDHGFFFQAEVGIRVIGVTGVQTCALPIFLGCSALDDLALGRIVETGVVDADRRERSEERRVGKECRSRWSAYL